MKFKFNNDMEYYRVYMNRGEICVRKGKFESNGNFVPNDAPKTYLTQNPTRILNLEYGKVICCDELDLPKAIAMVKDHYQKYGKEVKIRAEKVEQTCKEFEAREETFAKAKDKLIYQLVNDEITGAEYDEKLKALKKDVIYNYQFNISDAEFRAIKHALTNLGWQLSKIIDPVYKNRFRPDITFDEIARAKIELAVVKELLSEMKNTEKGDN